MYKKIKVQEPFYVDNDKAVFVKTQYGYKLSYWYCDHYIQSGSCIYCSLAIEEDIW